MELKKLNLSDSEILNILLSMTDNKKKVTK